MSHVNKKKTFGPVVAFPKAAGDLAGIFDPFSVMDVASAFKFPKSEGDYVASSANRQFESTLDGDPVVKTFNDFTIPTGLTVTTTKRCKGLYLNILGDLTIDGILSMSGKGTGKYNNKVINKNNLAPNVGIYKDRILYSDTEFSDEGVTPLDIIHSTGDTGKGGSGGANSNGTGGGSGANGSAFAGGDGGNGGIIGSASAGSGATYSNGGVGGVIILVVHGNITVTGSIQANGSDGSSGHSSGSNQSAGGGGGGGGGAIRILHAKDLPENIASKLDTSGGSGGAGSGGGKTGGKATDGTIKFIKIE